MNLQSSLTHFPLFDPQWVLWLLIALSLTTVTIILERAFFLRHRKINLATFTKTLAEALERAEFTTAKRFAESHLAMEAKVLLAGLNAAPRGVEAAEELMHAELGIQKKYYERNLSWLATIGSNSPFIGLFGTVLGIMRAFADLAANLSEASQAVMAGISEALIATAVGLFVAIPAIVAYNVFRAKLRDHTTDSETLARTLLAYLKSEPHLGARCIDQH